MEIKLFLIYLTKRYQSKHKQGKGTLDLAGSQLQTWNYYYSNISTETKKLNKKEKIQ